MRRPLTITIGGIAVAVHTTDEAFGCLLEERYAGFIESPANPDCEFVVDLAPAEAASGDDHDISVFREGTRWRIGRGDFRAEFDPQTRQGHIQQSAAPYALDTLLRAVHTLLLAAEGGFLLHASSAIRHGKAFIFAGVSGAGKTTIARLAPHDADVLTDEISYVRSEAGGYVAHGTPFAGDLGRPGANRRAPLAALFLLRKGSENRIEMMDPPTAARGLLENILFFAQDPGLVRAVFESALDFVERVPVRRLIFVPDSRVWELIR